MVHLKTIQAVAIKSLVEILKDIINDVNIYFDKTGMRIVALDVARVTLICVFLAAENFEEYSCPEDVILGVNMANIFKLLKSISNTDIITLGNTDEDLVITVTNSTKRSMSKFNVKLLDLNEDLLEIPTDSSEAKDTIDTSINSIEFQKIVRDMSNIGSDMTIHRVRDMVAFSCIGDFASKETILEQNEHTLLESKGVFSLKYISLFTKATILCPLVQIIQPITDEKPIIFKYSVANLGTICFYLSSQV
jgi:proliferating cell nuclear antigen